MSGSIQDESPLSTWRRHRSKIAIGLFVVFIVVLFASIRVSSVYISPYACEGTLRVSFYWDGTQTLTTPNVHIEDGKFIALHTECVILSGSKGAEKAMRLWTSDMIYLNGFASELGLPMLIEVYW